MELVIDHVMFPTYLSDEFLNFVEKIGRSEMSAEFSLNLQTQALNLFTFKVNDFMLSTSQMSAQNHTGAMLFMWLFLQNFGDITRILQLRAITF